MALNLITGVHIKRGNLDTDTLTERTPHEDEGRGQGDATEARRGVG